MLDGGNPQAAALGASSLAQDTPGGGGFEAARNDAMAQAYLTQGPLSEIGRAVGLHYATVSRIITALEKTSSYNMCPLLDDP